MKKIFIVVLLAAINSVAFAQTVPAYVDTNGLLGWYPFNGNANNAYGTGLNGVVMGPIATTDRFGNPNSAYHFDGILDHIRIDSAFLNIGWSSYTISWWMNNDSVDNPNNFNNNQLSFITIPHNGIGVCYNWGHSNKYELLAGSDPTASTWDILPGPYSNTDVDAHVWNHLVFMKQDDSIYRFYVNGVLDTQVISHIMATNYFCQFIFGNIDSTYPDEGVMGNLDDYGIWKRALTSCEIRRLFNSSPYLFITSQPTDVSAPLGTTAHFSIVDTNVGDAYQWQVNTGLGFSDLGASGAYSGVTTQTLTITGVTSSMNNNQYRCAVAGPDGCSDTSAYGRLFTGPLAVNNINATAAISVTPNPTNGELTINGAGVATVKVYNTVGQLVKQFSDTKNISIEDLPAAAYFLKLFDRNGTMLFYDKVIKR